MDCRFTTILIFLLAGAVANADQTAASLSQADVQAACDAATDGETVFLPAGDVTWTDDVVISNKGIHVRGAGIGVSIVRNGNASNGGKVFQFDSMVAKTFSLSHMTIDEALGSYASFGNVYVGCTDRTSDWSIHHVHFRDLRRKGLYVYDYACQSGVIYECTFDDTATETAALAIQMYGPEQDAWDDAAIVIGDEHQLYIEDCVFNFTNPQDGLWEGYYGARYCARYNELHVGTFGAHGYDGSGFFDTLRGTISCEVYNNTWAQGIGSLLCQFRSGVITFWGNRITGDPGFTGYSIRLDAYRATGDNILPFFYAFTTAFATDDKLDRTSNNVVNDRVVRMASTGALPAGLVANTPYWVVNRTANDFELSLTKGGASVDITSNGTGVHEYALAFYFEADATANTMSTPWGDTSLKNGEVVILSTTGTLPAPLQPNTRYYVVSRSGNNAGLSLTSGGASIDLTTIGTGTHEYEETEKWASGSYVRDGNAPLAGGSGTHNGNSNAVTLTDGTKTFTTNQWVGYYLWNTTGNSGGRITANTATTVTANMSAGTTDSDWDAGDTYKITGGYPVIDSVGFGPPDNFGATGNTQTFHGNYEWDNTYNQGLPSEGNANFAVGNTFSTWQTFYAGGSPILVKPTDLIQSGRDFFNDTPRPGYTPYTYPHPLRGAAAQVKRRTSQGKTRSILAR
jgi:hypothetical protein